MYIHKLFNSQFLIEMRRIFSFFITVALLLISQNGFGQQAVTSQPRAVDLGLSVNWASCNLGTDAPEEYGDYFAWGETEPYYSSQDPLTWKNGKSDGYDWPSYKWCKGSDDTFTKYCKEYSSGVVDNKIVLDSGDDAAHVKLGGKWRMPTDAEWTELKTECTWTWTSQGGKKGYKVTSKSNGNSIFLPAAGYRRYAYLNNAESDGYYWSSSLYKGSSSCAFSVFFYSAEVYKSDYYRYYGLSVRPVTDEAVRVSVTSVSLNKSRLNLFKNETAILTATVKSSYATQPAVIWSSGNPAVATVSNYGVVTAVGVGNTTITATNYDSGKTATCTVTVTSLDQPTGAVDLGLPSGLKWASCNLGANAPEDDGDYYAWGETAPKTVYSWSTYKWCKGSYDTLTKYCTQSFYGVVDNKKELDSGDDVAYVKLGGKWRMPTEVEWTELRTECTWTWTRQGGKEGYKVTSKSNGNSIFLPAAGIRSGTDLNDAGSYGYYWSSSITSAPYSAWYVSFGAGGIYGSSYYSTRCGGKSVRPVSK